MEISILNVNFEDDYEIKNPNKVIVGNIFDKSGQNLEENNNEIVIGEETEEGLNIRFVDKSKLEDLQKGSK